MEGAPVETNYCEGGTGHLTHYSLEWIFRYRFPYFRVDARFIWTGVGRSPLDNDRVH